MPPPKRMSVFPLLVGSQTMPSRGLKLLPRRRNVAVGWETGLADKRRKKNTWLGSVSGSGSNLGVPTQAVAQRQIRFDLPFILSKKNAGSTCVMVCVPACSGVFPQHPRIAGTTAADR